MIASSHLHRISEITLTKDVPFHSHPSTEIVFVLKGDCEIEIKSLTWKRDGKPGDIFILPNSVAHNQINRQETTTIYWVFKTDQFDTRNPLHISFPPKSVKGKLIKNWANDLLQLESSGSSEALLNSFLISILELIKEEITLLGTFSPPINATKSYIQNHFLEILSIEALASIAHLSASHLLARFKKEVGVSPIQYQIDLKLRKAKDLLTDPYLSVKEIALQCGFEDINYFGRLFRKHHHLTPGQWRLKSNSKIKPKQ
jgi:AraC-like DNA-binding protein